MPILRAALETTWNPAYPNCKANMATCSWTRSGTEHHILLEDVEPVSAIKADREKEIKRERRDGVEGKGEETRDIYTA